LIAEHGIDQRANLRAVRKADECWAHFEKVPNCVNLTPSPNSLSPRHWGEFDSKPFDLWLPEHAIDDGKALTC
jgi:hypothetical protein